MDFRKLIYIEYWCEHLKLMENSDIPAHLTQWLKPKAYVLGTHTVSGHS